MANQLLAYVLTIACILEIGTCLFYTNSKEHDYPRIGKRKQFEDYLEKGLFSKKLHRYDDSKKIIDELNLSAAVMPAVFLFQYFDVDNDGFISTSEFAKRMSGSLNLLMQKEYTE